MASRRSEVKHNEVVTVTFGADSGNLRLKIVQTTVKDIAVACTVNSATDPDLAIDSVDDNTFWIPADQAALEFTESAPSGPWEVRMQAKGGTAIVQLTDDS